MIQWSIKYLTEITNWSFRPSFGSSVKIHSLNLCTLSKCSAPTAKELKNPRASLSSAVGEVASVEQNYFENARNVSAGFEELPRKFDSLKAASKGERKK